MSEKHQVFIDQVANLRIWDFDNNEGTPYEECEEPGDGYLDSHQALMGLIEQARSIIGQCERETCPAGDCDEMVKVIMQDVASIVGDYEDPREVPEWIWIRENASHAHVGNGSMGGIWEFTLNLSLNFDNVPERLQSVIEKSRAMGASYILYYQ